MQKSIKFNPPLSQKDILPDLVTIVRMESKVLLLLLYKVNHGNKSIIYKQTNKKKHKQKEESCVIGLDWIGLDWIGKEWNVMIVIN